MRECRRPMSPADRKVARHRNRFPAILHALRAARAQIVKPAEDDRFSRANFCAGRHEPAFLPVVTEGAFESAAGIGQRLRATIDHAERTGDDAISAAVADIVLHEHASRLRCARSSRSDKLRDNRLLRNVCKRRREKSSETDLRLAIA